MSVLRVADLEVSYEVPHEEPLRAVRGVSLTVDRGQIVAVVGESGSGKSTTALAIMRMLESNARMRATAIELHTSGGPVALDALGAAELRRLRGREIGWVPQDPALSLDPVRRIGNQIAEVLLTHGLAGRREAEARAIEVLERVGIDHPRRRARQYPHELSGGQRQRVLIGIAVAAGPRLVIADEPTSALDVTTQRVIMDLLVDITAAQGASVLLITHDLGLAAERADTVIVMKDGEVVESGQARAVFKAPRSEYTRRLVEAAPRLDGPRLRPTRDKSPAPPILRADGLRKRFGTGPLRRRPHSAVDGVSLAVKKGATLGIVGESGSGKSTTARMLVRVHRPDEGTVHLEAEEVTQLRGERLRQMRRRLQFVHQDPYASLDPRRSVEHIVATPMRAFGIGDPVQRRARVAELLDQVALPASVARRLPRELSGGQRQRVAIARALAVQPEVIVLDEPVSALDVSVQAQVLALLVELQERHHLTYVFISHNLAVVRQFCDEVIVMRAGRVVEAGRAEEILRSPRVDYTRALLAAVPAVE